MNTIECISALFPKLQKIVMDGGFVEPAYDGLVLRTYR